MDDLFFEKLVNEIVRKIKDDKKPTVKNDDLGTVNVDDAKRERPSENYIAIESKTPQAEESKNKKSNTINNEETDCDIVFNADEQRDLLLDNPADLPALIRMKGHTSARIGVGKAGARLNTATMLKLRADHALARDAVFTDVNESVLSDLGLITFQTVVPDKNIFLTRPDLGKQFSGEVIDKIAKTAGIGNDVLIFAADGLSSTAIDANIKNILPVLVEGLKQKNLKVGNPFYVRFGRVGTEDVIAEATKSAVVCVLIGERPGLATAESMSAYICYNAYVGQPEARRTVVSNIHKGGTMAIEAGAYIVDIIEQILRMKASGVELKKQGDVI